MESQSAGFPPFPHSLEIPSGFPHFHGLGYDEISIEKQRQSPAVNHKLSPQLRKGLVTDVPGPICNACPGTLTPLGRVFAVAVRQGQALWTGDRSARGVAQDVPFFTATRLERRAGALTETGTDYEGTLARAIFQLFVALQP